MVKKPARTTKPRTTQPKRPPAPKGLTVTLPIEHRPKDAKGPNATVRFEPGDTFPPDLVEDKVLRRLEETLAVVPDATYTALVAACRRHDRDLPDLIILLRRHRGVDIDALVAEFGEPGPLTEKALQSPHAPAWRAFFD